MNKQGHPTKRAMLAKESLYTIGYEYLRENFRKFKEDNKIRVAIDVLKIFNKDDSKTQTNQAIINIIRADQSTKIEEKPVVECKADELSRQIPVQQ